MTTYYRVNKSLAQLPEIHYWRYQDDTLCVLMEERWVSVRVTAEPGLALLDLYPDQHSHISIVSDDEMAWTIFE